MGLSRRAFLLASCALPFGRPDIVHSASSRKLVIDHALVTRLPSAWSTSARFIPLHGDAWWLWHEHLLREMNSLHELAGFTRPADAFVLTHLAEAAGLRVTRRAHHRDAVLWTVSRDFAITSVSLE